MARARITENLGAGRYKIEVRQNTAAILARIADIDQQLAQLAARQSEQQSALTTAQAVLTDLDGQLIAILQNSTLTQAEKDKQTRAIVQKQRAQRLDIVKIESELALIDAQRLSLLTKQTELRRFETEHIKTVWCADYSPTLGPSASEEVGTLEVLGEEREVLLQPAKDQYRPWTPALDGELTPVIAQSPMQWLYNTCVVTGWQKYRPTYRFAKVLEILNHDQMKVQLIEPHKSSYGDVDVTPLNPDQSAVSYADVACEYLDCNTDAFAVDDEVVLQYTAQSPDAPKVIGFRKEPQPCPTIRFYTPYEKLTIPQEQWDCRAERGQQYGNAYWVGRTGALSWFGFGGRHFSHPQDPEPGPYIFRRGTLLAVAPGRVRGACQHVKDKIDWLVCVVRERDGNHTGDGNDYFYAIPLDGLTTAWTLLHTQSYGEGAPDDVNVSALHFDAIWFFNQSGTEGVCVKRQLGERPDAYADTFTRMVGFRLTFDADVPTGQFLWHPVRAYTEGTTHEFDLGCGSLGVLGIDCTTINNTTGAVTRFDVHADYVKDELITFDEHQEGGSIERIDCGPVAECFVLEDIRAEHVRKEDSTWSLSRLVCAALNFDELRFSLKQGEVVTYDQIVSERDDEGNCAPTVTQRDDAIETNHGHFIEWLDFQGGAGNVHYVYRDFQNDISNAATETRAYHISGGVTVTSTYSDLSSHHSTAFLSSKGVALRLGTLAANPWLSVFDPNIRDQFTAAADRRGHCLVSSEQLNTTVGHPELPAEVLRTFGDVGIG